jgi:hypothetical protein
MRTCPVCGDAFEFNPYGGNNSTCGSDCGKEAFRRRQVVITPNATKGRMAKMTQGEFEAALKRERRTLDDKPRQEGDRWFGEASRSPEEQARRIAWLKALHEGVST